MNKPVIALMQMQVQLYYRSIYIINLAVYQSQGTLKIRNPCNEVVLWTTSPCLQSFIATCQHFIHIDTTLSINTNISYMMCYPMRIYIATLPAICRRREA